MTIEDHVRAAWADTKGTGKILLIIDALQFLLTMNEPIPLGRHLAVNSLRRVLGVFLQKGFFIEKQEFLLGGASETSAEPGEAGKITTVGFVTCDRVPNLIRAVSSYIENAKNHGRAVEFAIFDDSQNRQALEALRGLKKKYDVPLLYAGKEEKEQFIHQVQAKGIPRDILEFCLFGLEGASPTMGANRNAFLLHTVGELTFSADDDTVCQIFKSPSFRTGVRIGGDPGSIKDIWCFQTPEQALKAVLPENVDFLALHEEALAPSMRSFLKQLTSNKRDQKIETASMGAGFFESINSGKAKTIVSATGLIGDSGAADPTFLFYLSTESRNCMLKSEQIFSSAFESRQMIRVRDRLTFFQSQVMVSMFFGLNHLDILPPFFPVFRSEDSLFGGLIDNCVPDACFAHLPWVVLHLPEKRSGYFELEGNQHEVKPSDLIIAAADELLLKETLIKTDARLRTLGACLKNLGDFPEKEFLTYLKRVKIQRIAGSLAGMTSLLNKYPDSPVYWKKSVQHRLEKYRSLLENPDEGIPPMMLEKWGKEESLKVSRRLVSLYGELLVWWPEIEKATRELKKKGIRVAQPVT